MSTLRRDPITGRWVVDADITKGKSSSLIGMEELARTKKICPFCEGNEKYTPPELFALRNDESEKNEPGWQVRVVPDISPALRVEGELDRRAELMYDLMNAVGAHEIIIETPRHVSNLADLEVSQIQKVMQAYKERILDLKKDKRFRSIVIFKNYGKKTGSSPIEHAHSQLIALSITPKNVKEELKGAKEYYDYKNRCVYCDITRQELSTQKRIVSTNPHFVALCPFASRFTHEVWILPQKHSVDFEQINDELAESLASLLKEVLHRLKILLKDPPYNLILHTGPNRTFRKGGAWKTLDEDYHWHLEIMPHPTRMDGFEWGTGFYINFTTPEKAAEGLRKVKI
jgi:UDPglucose--hexose-1-phosphate uridylyltransferase